jgi:hypothetical protein
MRLTPPEQEGTAGTGAARNDRAQNGGPDER